MPRKRRPEPSEAIHWIRDPATIELLASPLRRPAVADAWSA